MNNQYLDEGLMSNATAQSRSGKAISRSVDDEEQEELTKTCKMMRVAVKL